MILKKKLKMILKNSNWKIKRLKINPKMQNSNNTFEYLLWKKKNCKIILAPDLFLFFEKTLCKIKEEGSTLMLAYFGRSRLGHTIKANL